jgi:hypothetical protein
MPEKLTNALLRKAAAAAARHAELSSRITDAMNDRYGCSHSDVDCDPLIDALDYGLAHDAPTVADCDREMSLLGIAPLARGAHSAIAQKS